LRSSMLPGHYSKENSISVHQVLTTYVASHFSLTVFNTLSLISWVSYSWHTQAVEYASYHPPTLYRISSLLYIKTIFVSSNLMDYSLSNYKTLSPYPRSSKYTNSKPAESVLFKCRCPCFYIARYCQDFYFDSHCFSSLHVPHKQNM
jgi:hypothetical protein